MHRGSEYASLIVVYDVGGTFGGVNVERETHWLQAEPYALLWS